MGGEWTLFDRVRYLIGKMAFRVTLWANRQSREQFFDTIYRLEKSEREELEL